VGKKYKNGNEKKKGTRMGKNEAERGKMKGKIGI
jgi:hypothetical protein